MKNSIYGDPELPGFFTECLSGQTLLSPFGDACALWVAKSFNEGFAAPNTSALLSEIQTLGGQYPGLSQFAQWVASDSLQFTNCVESMQNGDPDHYCSGAGSWSETALNAVGPIDGNLLISELESLSALPGGLESFKTAILFDPNKFKNCLGGVAVACDGFAQDASVLSYGAAGTVTAEIAAYHNGFTHLQLLHEANDLSPGSLEGCLAGSASECVVFASAFMQVYDGESWEVLTVVGELDDLAAPNGESGCTPQVVNGAGESVGWTNLSPGSYLVTVALPNGCSDTVSVELECIPSVPGCTNPDALNFEPAATIDDDSCLLWELCESCYSESASLTIAVGYGGGYLADPGDVLAAFDADGNVRGIGSMVFVPFGPFAGSYLWLLNVYSDSNGESMSFQYYDSSEGTVLPISNTYNFVANDVGGSLFGPLIFTAF